MKQPYYNEKAMRSMLYPLCHNFLIPSLNLLSSKSTNIWKIKINNESGIHFNTELATPNFKQRN